MAASSSSKKKNINISHPKQPDYLYPLQISSDNSNLFDLELQESDVVWGSCEKPTSNMSSSSSSPCKTRAVVMIPPAAMCNASKKTQKKAVAASASSPVSVPEWSRIRRFIGDDHEAEEDEESGTSATKVKMKLPPHEYLAMRRGDSFSVHEGMGRTLKGRELCRFRNEVLKKLVGFED